MEKEKSGAKQKKKIYIELFFLILGSFMIYMGVIDEMRHVSSISYNSKGCMSVNTGAKDALFGLLIIIGSVCSIYAKIKNKSNQ
jgi:hypothetical protein